MVESTRLRCAAQRQRVTDLLCQIAACTWLIQSPKRVTDREPNDAAGRDSGEEHPIYRFKGKHGTTLLLILRICYMQRACLGTMPGCGQYGGSTLYVGHSLASASHLGQPSANAGVKSRDRLSRS